MTRDFYSVDSLFQMHLPEFPNQKESDEEEVSSVTSVTTPRQTTPIARLSSRNSTTFEPSNTRQSACNHITKAVNLRTILLQNNKLSSNPKFLRNRDLFPSLKVVQLAGNPLASKKDLVKIQPADVRISNNKDVKERIQSPLSLTNTDSGIVSQEDDDEMKKSQG